MTSFVKDAGALENGAQDVLVEGKRLVELLEVVRHPTADSVGAHPVIS